MKVLTAEQMREVDRRTIELGIPAIVLMENAAHRVLEYLQETFATLKQHRIVVFCGKGNNGGDGLAIARQLHIRICPKSLDVVLAGNPNDLRGDAAENYRMLSAVGCPVTHEIKPEMRSAGLVIDALLGTGLKGPATGTAAELIRQINDGFPSAEIVAVDVPSGLNSDSGSVPGEAVRAGHTVTFTAPKVCHVLAPACYLVGKLRVAPIGSPSSLIESDLSLSCPDLFRHLFQPRPEDSNKGMYGHVLVIAGARGKTGAAAMAGVAALRSGAGLSTVASAESAITAIASYAPEIMTEPLPETHVGSVSVRTFEGDRFARLIERKTVIACGPGLGTYPESVEFVRHMLEQVQMPVVIDADALSAIGQVDLHGPAFRVLTPHPGEMARLLNCEVAEVQKDRVGVARAFARERGLHLVLKGDRTVIAAPDGRVWINPTGSPALATAGTGDVLTGMTAGLIAQFPDKPEIAVLAAVYLHGRAGELGAAKLGERCIIATDIFRFLPEAIREITALSDSVRGGDH